MTDFFNESTSTDLQDGFIGCLIGAAYADGEASDDDFGNLTLGYFNRSIFLGIDINDILKKHIFDQHQYDDKLLLLKNSAKKVTEEWKPTVFAVCCDIIFRDRIVTKEEKEYLKNLKGFLGLPEDIAGKIIDVMVIQYKGLV